MSDSKGAPYRLDPGPDVDLDGDDVRDSYGRRIDQAYVDAAVSDAHEKLGRGRPSLTRSGSTSPQVTFRLPAELRRDVERQARREGTPVSGIARKALEEYLDRHREAS